MSPAGALTHRQVRWRIVFSKEGQEVSFPYRMALLAGDVKEQDFRDQTCAQWLSELDRIERPQVWIDQDYPQGVEGDYIEALPSADIGYVNLDLDVLSYDPANDGGGSFVRLPGSGVVAGPLDCNLSEFGDEFYGLPSDFGKRPPPGRTYLSGWIEFTFDKPVGHDVRFVIHYLGLGNEVTNTWGGGQLFEHHRLKCFPMTFLPDLKTQIFNEGKLDLRTGVVDAASVRVYSIFQGSIIAGTDRRNRIGHAFPYMYPMVPPVPPPGQRPPGWEAPPEDLNTFASVRFHYDWSGSITGAELHSKTIALVGLFPIVNRLGTPEQKLFPPFSFGRNMAFYFANPTRCLAGTPPGSRYDTSAAPNGTPTAMSVFFRPHIHLHSDHVRETPSKPQSIPCVPHAIARCTSVVTADCLFLIGGLDDSGVSARVQIFDPATDKWSVGPPLPLPVFGAQGDAIGTRIYVTGGWTGALNERRIVDEMQILDTATGVWSRGPKMPCALAEGTACAVRDRLYVISGWDKDGQISRVV